MRRSRHTIKLPVTHNPNFENASACLTGRCVDAPQNPFLAMCIKKRTSVIFLHSTLKSSINIGCPLPVFETTSFPFEETSEFARSTSGTVRLPSGASFSKKARESPSKRHPVNARPHRKSLNSLLNVSWAERFNELSPLAPFPRITLLTIVNISSFQIVWFTQMVLGYCFPYITILWNVLEFEKRSRGWWALPSSNDTSIQWKHLYFIIALSFFLRHTPNCI